MLLDVHFATRSATRVRAAVNERIRFVPAQDISCSAKKALAGYPWQMRGLDNVEHYLGHRYRSTVERHRTCDSDIWYGLDILVRFVVLSGASWLQYGPRT